jgi:putative flippase GtrA
MTIRRSTRNWTSTTSEVTSAWRRWLTFNAVGGCGIVIQLSILAALTSGFGLNYLLSTALAVEAAVLHNFIWHERWTWRDRASRDQVGRWKRLLRFQCANGALSLGGNLLLMQLLVGVGKMNSTLANLVTISLCSILNFVAGDRWVFAPARRA